MGVQLPGGETSPEADQAQPWSASRRPGCGHRARSSSPRERSLRVLSGLTSQGAHGQRMSSFTRHGVRGTHPGRGGPGAESCFFNIVVLFLFHLKIWACCVRQLLPSSLWKAGIISSPCPGQAFPGCGTSRSPCWLPPAFLGLRRGPGDLQLKRSPGCQGTGLSFFFSSRYKTSRSSEFLHTFLSCV